jgi:hypothetical protein
VRISIVRVAAIAASVSEPYDSRFA